VEFAPQHIAPVCVLIAIKSEDCFVRLTELQQALVLEGALFSRFFPTTVRSDFKVCNHIFTDPSAQLLDSDLIELELLVLEKLDFDLTIHHPHSLIIEYGQPYYHLRHHRLSLD
jgi:hypothetical protein